MSLATPCEWPEEDGRKLKRSRQMSMTSMNSEDANPSNRVELQTIPDSGEDNTVHPPSLPINEVATLKTSINSNGGLDPPGIKPPAVNNRSDSSASETLYQTVHYFRHLGPTAIAPGHKKISLKARRDDEASANTADFSFVRPSSERRGQSSILPLFDSGTGFPAKEILPDLIDKFFEYYGDIFCFINRGYLEFLITEGNASVFLVSVISALASRFCDHKIFRPYFVPAMQKRESWEFSNPFLEKSKSLVMSAISLPAPEVAAGLLMLAFADFGDNNEVSHIHEAADVCHLSICRQGCGYLPAWHYEWYRSWVCTANGAV